MREDEGIKVVSPCEFRNCDIWTLAEDDVVEMKRLVEHHTVIGSVDKANYFTVACKKMVVQY